LAVRSLLRLGVALVLVHLLAVPTLAQHTGADTTDMRRQRDIIDLYNYVFRRDSSFTRTDSAKRPGRLYLAFGAAAGYTQQTGLGLAGTINLAFLTWGGPTANLSTIFLSPTLTQRGQIYLPIQTSIWTRDNRYNLVSDVRIVRNVQDNFGLGSSTSEAARTVFVYNFVRVHGVLFRALGHDLFVGGGVQLDYFWNVRETEVPPELSPSPAEAYGLRSAAMTAGLVAELLYDTRRNSLNPTGGHYANLALRHNPAAFGTTTPSSTLLIDLRAYRTWPRRSRNVIAVWAYASTVMAGRPHYIDLPGTGLDQANNTGRGYPSGRFRGRTFVDLEAEYRIQLTRNGLFGMVVFGSVQSLAGYPVQRLERLAPAGGAGLRMKFNKYSRANISLDWGFGLYGASNLLLNVGEVF